MTGWTVPGYTETASLGSGATGRVVAAVEDATGATVAIKYLSSGFLDDEAFLERFRAEAALLAGLEHPNVVRFLRYVEAGGSDSSIDSDSSADSADANEPDEADGEATLVDEAADEETVVVGDEETVVVEEPEETVVAEAEADSETGTETDTDTDTDTEDPAAEAPVTGPPAPLGAALIMELVDGATLRRVLKTSGPISPEAALSVMRGSLLGLDAAHHLGIVHRDYKPANVLLTAEGVSKLADFGIAERAGTEMPAIGTPSYMAPEQWEGAPAEPVTDIYAVTASFYECLTGHVPFAAETVFELEELHRTAPIPLGDVPPAVRGLVAHGLAKDAGLRPADVATFIAELEEAASAEYGVEWEERGRRDLAVFVWPLSTGSTGDQGPQNGSGGTEHMPAPQPDGDWFHGMSDGPGPEEEPGGAWHRIGRGTKAGLAAAVVAVLGSVLAAVAFGSGGADKTPVAGSTGIMLRPPTFSASPTPSSTPSPTLQAGVNAPSPTTPTPTKPTKTSTSSKPTPTPTRPPTPTSSLNLLPASSSAPTSSAPTSTSSTPSTTASQPSSPPTSASSSSSAGYTVTADLSAISAKWSGVCPAPADATQFQVTFRVSGDLPNGSVPVTFNWQGGRSRAITVQLKDGSSSFTHNVGGQQSSTVGSVSVSWSAPGGFGGVAGPVPYSINCEVIQ